VLSFSGIPGRFSCSGTTATLLNDGGGYLSWSISCDFQLRFSPASGTLTAGQSVTIAVSAQCNAGEYRVGGQVTSNAGNYPFVSIVDP
jgi:hypothetical protein